MAVLGGEVVLVTELLWEWL